MSVSASDAAHCCLPSENTVCVVGVESDRRELRWIIRFLGEQMGEPVKKQRGRALFVRGLLTRLSFTVCLQNETYKKLTRH